MKIGLLVVGVALVLGMIFVFQSQTKNTKKAHNNSEKEEKTVSNYKNVNTKEFDELLKDGNVLIVDVRTQTEYDSGRIRDAKLIPIDAFDKTLDKEPLAKGKKILIYCHSGNRSRTAAASLVLRGYEEVYNLQYGITEWEQAGMTVEK